ncbi:SAM-dependent methyltransferase [Streptomyces canus]|uniref:SAM-dependent methyltransferase n=2 Tax=Streptomyces canus TaxID=58343 RepID=A0AAW8F2Y8_9ACTN|nr:SAM-dependent methyltransferase [Streptomyces canus]MDQ1064674.1 SAM-dependent methyltransferase [Streptomyces canus]
MTPQATLARFREYMVGPSRFMSLLSCFELGLIDRLRESPGLGAVELGEAAGVKPDAVEQLLFLLVKEGFVAFDEECGGYRLDALGEVGEEDLQRALRYMNLIKVTALRQLFYLTQSARSGSVVGLRELYGAEGTLYDAVAGHQDLKDAWLGLMNTVTANIDPWFFGHVEIPAGARVLDLAGNTGLGAIHAYRYKESAGLSVTTFDLPEKEQEALANFRAEGLQEHLSFIGGNVFDGVPEGFDTVLVKHFLDMFDRDDVLRILAGVHRSLQPGGQVHVLVPVYPEDIRDAGNYNVDFFPAFFIGCTMGQGGPQKLSVYQRWLEESGFKVTKAVTKDASEIPPDVIPVQAVISATKIA